VVVHDFVGKIGCGRGDFLSASRGEQPLDASLNQNISVFSGDARIMVSLVTVDFANQSLWVPTMQLRVKRLVPP
jgi:hypothetical protein